MESSTHPYVKLSQTPLAQQTTVCSLPARTASLVMGLFALVVVSGSHFVLGALLLKSRPDYEEEDFHKRSKSMWGDDFMDNARKRHEDSFNYSVLSVVGGMAIFAGIITTITGIIILVGALNTKPALFIPWYITMFFGIFLGRLGPLMSSIFGANPYTKFFILMALIDVVTIILLVICWGQLAGVQRNNRYMNWTQGPRYNVKSADGQMNPGSVLLPPGSYPRQEV